MIILGRCGRSRAIIMEDDNDYDVVYKIFFSVQ